MQSLSSSFPAGAPGSGLLLLRFAASASLLSESSGGHSSLLPIVAVTVTLCLSIGFLTVIAAFLATLMQVIEAFTAGTEAVVIVFVSSALPLALTLLGPGAYSLDARLFGRRLIFESRRSDGGD